MALTTLKNQTTSLGYSFSRSNLLKLLSQNLATGKISDAQIQSAYFADVNLLRAEMAAGIAQASSPANNYRILSTCTEEQYASMDSYDKQRYTKIFKNTCAYDIYMALFYKRDNKNVTFPYYEKGKSTEKPSYCAFYDLFTDSSYITKYLKQAYTVGGNALQQITYVAYLKMLYEAIIDPVNNVVLIESKDFLYSAEYVKDETATDEVAVSYNTAVIKQNLRTLINNAKSSKKKCITATWETLSPGTGSYLRDLWVDEHTEFSMVPIGACTSNGVQMTRERLQEVYEEGRAAYTEGEAFSPSYLFNNRTKFGFSKVCKQDLYEIISCKNFIDYVEETRVENGVTVYTGQWVAPPAFSNQLSKISPTTNDFLLQYFNYRGEYTTTADLAFDVSLGYKMMLIFKSSAVKPVGIGIYWDELGFYELLLNHYTWSASVNSSEVTEESQNNGKIFLPTPPNFIGRTDTELTLTGVQQYRVRIDNMLAHIYSQINARYNSDALNYGAVYFRPSDFAMSEEEFNNVINGYESEDYFFVPFGKDNSNPIRVTQDSFVPITENQRSLLQFLRNLQIDADPNMTLYAFYLSKDLFSKRIFQNNQIVDNPHYMGFDYDEPFLVVTYQRNYVENHGEDYLLLTNPSPYNGSSFVAARKQIFKVGDLTFPHNSITCPSEERLSNLVTAARETQGISYINTVFSAINSNIGNSSNGCFVPFTKMGTPNATFATKFFTETPRDVFNSFKILNHLTFTLDDYTYHYCNTEAQANFLRQLYAGEPGVQIAVRQILNGKSLVMDMMGWTYFNYIPSEIKNMTTIQAIENIKTRESRFLNQELINQQIGSGIGLNSMPFGEGQIFFGFTYEAAKCNFYTAGIENGHITAADGQQYTVISRDSTGKKPTRIYAPGIPTGGLTPEEARHTIMCTDYYGININFSRPTGIIVCWGTLQDYMNLMLNNLTATT